MDAVATGAAANVCSEVAKAILQGAARHIRYVIIYKKNVEKFEEKLKTLIARRTSMEQYVGVARRNGEKINAYVQDWSNKVDKAIIEVEKEVNALEVKAMSKCFSGLCPNIKSRYRLSRKAEEAVNTFDSLINDCHFEHVGVRDVPKEIIHTDFETFNSREKVFNDIMESLKDSTVRMIGVYGMPGVGKTYLVNEVYRQAQEDKSFDSVVIVTVSQKPDIQRIQGEIAESLGSKLEENTTAVRARRLYERLTKEERVLIILDNIWEKLDLNEVGIPFGSKHKGCKILLTSRNENLLCSVMGATNTFQLGDLDDKEAWEFFKKIAGDSVERVDLRLTAIGVAKSCAGLPLAISTVAKALQNRELFVWKEALRQLERPYSENPSGISADIYKAIELSFNQLPDDAHKQTFLLCSLLRREISIEDLLRYAVGLGLINGVNTMEEARNNLLTKTSYLKRSSLLIHNTGEKYWDVHDLIYIVAKSIASKDYQMFSFGKEDDRTEWPDGESLKKWNQFCLLNPSINELPDQLNCPQLKHFLLYNKDHSLTLPADFFKEATNLKVIDLTCMQFSSLPSSICLLTSLSTLCLDQCKLGDDITIIGGLKGLEILSLIRSDIKILPKEIGQLLKLKLLDVSRSVNLKTIPVGVLSSLTRLEELYTGGTSIQWGQGSTASLAELNMLSRLSTLEVQIPDAKAAPQNFFEGLLNLKNYKIFIGEEWEWECFGNYQYCRTINLKLSTSIDDLDRGIKKLLKKTEYLLLDELTSVEIALQELTDEESLSGLKNLHIKNGLDVEYIVNGEYGFPQLQSMTLQSLPQLISFCPQDATDATSSLPQHESPLFSEKVSFPCLEELWLKSINVTRIWHNQISTVSFQAYGKLTTLKIEGCGSLKLLLSFSMAKCLVYLTDFEIIGCDSLREIIFMEETEEETQTSMSLSLFPRLNSLKLRNLQHLIGFCSDSGTQIIEFPAMKSLMIDNCPELEGFICRSSIEGDQHIPSQVLFDNKVVFPSLEEISISYSRKMKMLWENPLPPTSFSKLQHLRVEGCDELLTIFPSNMLTVFQGLQILIVRNCASLEQIFEIMHEEKEVALPATSQLRELHILGLPKLKYIWENDPKGIFSFKNLCQVSVGDCWMLKNIFPASVASDLPQLGDLAIFHCGVEEIVSRGEEGLDSETTVITFKFDLLSSITLCGLHECKCFYSGSHTTKWPMLKEIESHECEQMKIFGTQLVTHNEQRDSPPPLFLVEKVIPKLRHLTLGGDYIEMISGGQFSSSLFHEIKTFRVEGNVSETVDFQISFLERFSNLEELCISYCEVKELFCTEGDTGKGTYAGTLSTIKKLELRDLHNLKDYLWKQDVQVDKILPNLEILEVYECENLMSLGSSSASFENLTTLKVWDCKGMKYLDTCLTVQGLSQLKKLIIGECISVKEIVGSEDDEATCDIIFSRLKSLELVNLPRLQSFCSGNHTFGFPCLEEVIVSGCPELGIFCKGVLNAPLLQSVEYGRDKGHWSGDLDSTVQQLHLTKVGFQGTRYLVLSEFSKSIEIWKEKSLDFKYLRVLKVEDCNNLNYIFTVSMALELVQLTDLKVQNCSMEYIVKKGTEETTIDTLLLPKLRRIKLRSCSELTSFCMGSITLQYSSLTCLKVDDCPKMYAMAFTRDVGGGEKTPFFNDKVLCPNLRLLQLSSTNIQKLWPDKPHSAIPSNVQNLRNLTVKGCHNLEYLFPSYLIKNFVRLSSLGLFNCENMEQVIFTEDEGITDIYLFNELHLLHFNGLPKLKTFCHGDNSETDEPALFNEKVQFPSLDCLIIVDIGNCRKIWQDKVTTGSFYELTFLRVRNCENLSNILPFSMVERLEKLETLQICECESVEQIIGPEDGHRLNSNESHEATSTKSIELESTIKFVFPKISKLKFRGLPKLKSFFSNVHTTEWPSLKKLKVRDCSMVKTFSREYIKFGETQGESQPLISVQQPLFWVTQETFPILEELYLFLNDNMEEIWHGALPNQYFCKLRLLSIFRFPETAVTAPYCFIQSLPNLEVLQVDSTAFEELFPSEVLRDEEKHAGTLAHLKELTLIELPMLTNLWNKEEPFAEDLYNLEILQVIECGKLKNLVPNSVSFKHLTTLEVSKCHGLRSLVTFTTAKNMVQLKTMSVTDCQMIEEIIAATTDEVTNVIVFNQLESLELDSLPCLSSFCSGNYAMVFPVLQEVIMGHCPKMEIFTMGELSTPMLSELQSTSGEEVELREGNLNATIQQLFIEKVFPSTEDLELSSINIQRALNHKLQATHSYAQNLTCLTIEGCHNLNCLFSPSMVKSFVQLKKLNIENCENVETVIFVEGSAEEEMISRKSFHVLEFLVLKDLPKLTRFCYGDYFEFPSLTSLSIETSPTLKTCISGAQGINSEIDSLTLFDEKVAFPCLEEASIIGVGNWRSIWQKQPTNCVRIHFGNY